MVFVTVLGSLWAEHVIWILDTDEVTHVPISEGDESQAGVHSRTHDDGWTISGEVHSDWYSWVTDFTAIHPEHGTITRRDDTVTAPSKEVWDAFSASHSLQVFDLHDI